MNLNFYRAEGCGIRDMTQFLLRNHISKTTLVKMFCDYLSGVERRRWIHAPYRKWIGTDDDVYGDIRKNIRGTGWKIKHVKGHQSKEQLQNSLTARLNEEVDKHAKEHLEQNRENGNKRIVCTNGVTQSDDIWCNSEDLAKFPVLMYGRVKRSASIEDSLCEAYNKKLYSQYN